MMLFSNNDMEEELSNEIVGRKSLLYRSKSPSCT
jgi:hypothetical protein